jgi:molecular chaperone HtpG
MSTTIEKTPGASSHQHEFKAEIRQLLDILIHSVYTSKDVFLRELISNASDALEKVRFRQASGAQLASPDLPLEIRIDTHGEGDDKTLVIADTGIGMTEEEVHANIGTIAHSGATAFLEQLKQAGQDPARQLSLIGRFGVGFYSVFMAAGKIVLTTRTAEPAGKPVRWTSEGLGSFTIETLDDDLPRGTRIEIHLKKDDERFAEADVVKRAIQRYSNFVAFPVLVAGERVNQTVALWREPASQIKPEQYSDFFKLISHEDDEPLARLHFSADAPIQFSSLLFVPAHNPEALGFGRGEVSLHLYVKRVLIDPENKNLLPAYLRFVRGVVESDDLPLNVSRETLQENRVVMKIRDTLTRRMLDQLLELAKDKPDDYAKFWNAFGRILREGYNDYTNREKFQDLLRFNSSRHADAEGLLSLADYVAAMPAGQKAIYYLSGASREALLRDPRLELFRKRNVEVLYLVDAADEFILSQLGKYHDKPLESADQTKPEDLKDLGAAEKADEENKDTEAAVAEAKPLLARCKEILGDRVLDVRVSERLVDSPACLVGDDDQMSVHMDKMMRLMQKSAELPKRVLELNPKHPLVKNLEKMVAENPQDPLIARACEQLFEGCMLVDGYLADPHEFVERMHAILADAVAAKTPAK